MLLKKLILKIKNFYLHRNELLQILDKIKKIKYKKILIIASSNSSSKFNKGSEIDKFEYIIRFNGAPTKNFENIVGSKTNMMCVSEDLFKKNVNLLIVSF